ncbi:hypothetical protein JCM11491_000459 [Sporobolomyces phaffii]
MLTRFARLPTTLRLTRLASTVAAPAPETAPGRAPPLAVEQLATPPPLATVPPPTRSIQQPVGAFRGGLIGFLLGLTALGGYGYYLLLGDYERASKQLVESVKNLELSTSLISSQLDRISVLETRLESVEASQVAQSQLAALRSEYKKLSESQHLDLINLKAHVWAIEQDLVNFEKRNELERKRGNQTLTLRI